MFPLQRNCDDFYGDPRGASPSRANAEWEERNIVRISPPFRMYYDGNPVSTIRVHRKCAESLSRVLDRIWAAAGKRQEVVDAWGASNFGGSYVYRMKRGGGTLSMHAYGCAIDLDPARNGFHNTRGNFNYAPQVAVVHAFEAEGWEWGGRWQGRACDPMHFQAARTRPGRPNNAELAAAQDRLRQLNYAPGKIDGKSGNLTVSALAAFQDAAGLPVSGELDEDTAQRLKAPDAPPRPVSTARERMTADDLLADGSRTIEGARVAKSGVIGTALAGASTGMAGLAQMQDAMYQVQDGVETVRNGGGFLIWAAHHWQMLLILALVLAVIYFAWRAFKGADLVEEARVDDARTARNSER